ncbi:gluconokinase [Myceligenerans crystallogenes]
MGVAGSGKSTVAELLAERLGAEYADADAFHPPENVAKMAGGIPLDDDDRAPWLAIVRDWMADHGTRRGADVVVACSALRRAYRDVLRDAGGVVFVHLTGSAELLGARIAARPGHFMKPDMLASQLATLEPLAPGEPGFTVDITPGPTQIVAEIVGRLPVRFS